MTSASIGVLGGKSFPSFALVRQSIGFLGVQVGFDDFGGFGGEEKIADFHCLVRLALAGGPEADFPGGANRRSFQPELRGPQMKVLEQGFPQGNGQGAVGIDFKFPPVQLPCAGERFEQALGPGDFLDLAGNKQDFRRLKGGGGIEIVDAPDIGDQRTGRFFRMNLRYFVPGLLGDDFVALFGQIESGRTGGEQPLAGRAQKQGQGGQGRKEPRFHGRSVARDGQIAKAFQSP